MPEVGTQGHPQAEIPTPKSGGRPEKGKWDPVASSAFTKKHCFVIREVCGAGCGMVSSECGAGVSFL